MVGLDVAGLIIEHLCPRHEVVEAVVTSVCKLVLGALIGPDFFDEADLQQYVKVVGSVEDRSVEAAVAGEFAFVEVGVGFV